MHENSIQYPDHVTVLSGVLAHFLILNRLTVGDFEATAVHMCIAMLLSC